MRTAEKTKKVMWWTEHKYYYIKVDRNSIGSHEKYKLTFDSWLLLVPVYKYIDNKYLYIYYNIFIIIINNIIMYENLIDKGFLPILYKRENIIFICPIFNYLFLIFLIFLYILV